MSLCVIGVHAYVTMAVSLCTCVFTSAFCVASTEKVRSNLFLVFQVPSEEVKGLKCVSYVLLSVYISKKFSFCAF